MNKKEEEMNNSNDNNGKLKLKGKDLHQSNYKKQKKLEKGIIYIRIVVNMSILQMNI